MMTSLSSSRHVSGSRGSLQHAAHTPWRITTPSLLAMASIASPVCGGLVRSRAPKPTCSPRATAIHNVSTFGVAAPSVSLPRPRTNTAVAARAASAADSTDDATLYPTHAGGAGSSRRDALALAFTAMMGPQLFAVGLDSARHVIKRILNPRFQHRCRPVTWRAIFGSPYVAATPPAVAATATTEVPFEGIPNERWVKIPVSANIPEVRQCRVTPG
jgi:hypothetical protein